MVIPITDAFTLTCVYILTGLIGLAVGSFLNVVIYRLPLGMSLASPPSHCTSCNYTLKWYDNIPVLSYTFLKGKCRKCGAHISFRYTAVEITNTALWLLCALLFAETSIVYAVLAMVVCSCCICIFYIDAETKIINDRFVIAIAVCGVLAIFCRPALDWLSCVIGGVAGFLLFYLIAVIGTKVYGREAMGGGDIKLAGAAGLLLGWQKLILMLLLASVVASIVMLITRRRDTYQNESDLRDTKDDLQVQNGKNSTADLREVAFGPYLAAAITVSLLFGDLVLNWYISLLM